MTEPKTNSCGPEDQMCRAEPNTAPAADLQGLSRALLDKLTDDQIALIAARRASDPRAAVLALLTVRATAMLLASLPARKLEDLHAKVIAAAVLRAEDSDTHSHARRMVELAIESDTDRLQGSDALN